MGVFNYRQKKSIGQAFLFYIVHLLLILILVLSLSCAMGTNMSEYMPADLNGLLSFIIPISLVILIHKLVLIIVINLAVVFGKNLQRNKKALWLAITSIIASYLVGIIVALIFPAIITTFESNLEEEKTHNKNKFILKMIIIFLIATTHIYLCLNPVIIEKYIYNKTKNAVEKKEYPYNGKSILENGHYFLALYEEHNGQYEEAIKNYTEAIEFRQKEINKIKNIISEAKSIQNKDAINKYAGFLLKLHQTDEIYLKRGTLYSKLGQKEKAVDDYTTVIDMNGKNKLVAYYNRASINSSMKNYDEAIKDYTTLINEKKDVAIGYIQRGKLYVQTERYKDALSDYDKALEINNTGDLNIYIFVGRGDVLMELEKKKEAIENYEKAANTNIHNNKDSYIYLNRGYANLRVKNYEKAIEDFEHSVNINSSDANLYANHWYKAVVYYQTKNYEKALQFLNDGLSKATEDITIRIRYYGLLYLTHSRLNNKTEAQKYYDEILNLDPKFDIKSFNEDISPL